MEPFSAGVILLVDGKMAAESFSGQFRAGKYKMMCFKKTFGLATAILLFAVLAGFGAEPGRKMLRGHVPKILSQLAATGNFPATNQLSLAIGLPIRHQAALDDFLRELYDPGSVNFRKYLTPAEFTARFGPAESDYNAVINFARTNGLTIRATHGNRLLLDVDGPVSAVENAFHVTLRVYHHPTEKRDFFAPAGEPSVDATLPIADVSGLDDFSQPHPHLQLRPSVLSTRAGSGSGGTYLGGDFRAAYAPDTTLTGAGQIVGLVQFDGFYSNDIVSYASTAGMTNVPLQTVLIDGFSGTPTTGSGSGNDEVSLDIETTMSMAPALNAIVLFEGNPNPGHFLPNDVLNTMVASNMVKNLSSSWGWSGGPSTTTDAIFQEMAAQGQTYFNASGDSDAFPAGYVDNAIEATAPSSSPYITQVGATTLTTKSAAGPYGSETVWNWGLTGTNYLGSSGGVSTYYSIPSWQQGIQSFQDNGGSLTARNIPDVAMVGDNVYVAYGNGSSGPFGGTSCAAPLWAGFIALVNQQAAANGQSPVGFINPAIYELANESIYGTTFHDVTAGNNTWPSSPNAFFAVPNYDLCTGIGSPAGNNLINALLNPDPLVVVSNFGFTATSPGNGIFNVSSQIFSLTNTSASTLTWSLINTSAWLDVSLPGDTLAAGAGDSVIVNLDPVTTNLTMGTYTATLWFSNVTTSVAHARQFTLIVKDALVILPTNSFSFTGQPGGPFTPSAQTITLTNLRSDTLNWSLQNTSAWFNVSPLSGSIAANSSSAVTVTFGTAATNLANGTYHATFVLTNLNNQSVQFITNTLTVSQSIILNGGFETGDFTDWTLAGDAGNYDFVGGTATLTAIAPHSGSYYAALGEVSVLAHLSQTLPTAAGQKYQLAFWLDSPQTGNSSNPNEFAVSWNGSKIYDHTNLAKFAWSNLVFTVTATSANTVLQFGGRNDNYYLGLDDVSVIPIFSPSIVSQPTNLAVLSGSNVIFAATASGSAPLIYQWQQNGTNLVNGTEISGAKSNVLTLAAITATNAGNYALIVTNAFGAVTSSVVTLTIALPPSIAGVVLNPDGSVTLNLAGSPGVNYILETTTQLDPSDWLPIATNAVGTNGVWQFNDLQTTNFLQRFYRLEFSP